MNIADRRESRSRFLEWHRDRVQQKWRYFWLVGVFFVTGPVAALIAGVLFQVAALFLPAADTIFGTGDLFGGAGMWLVGTLWTLISAAGISVWLLLIILPLWLWQRYHFPRALEEWWELDRRSSLTLLMMDQHFYREAVMDDPGGHPEENLDFYRQLDRALYNCEGLYDYLLERGTSTTTGVRRHYYPWGCFGVPCCSWTCGSVCPLIGLFPPVFFGVFLHSLVREVALRELVAYRVTGQMPRGRAGEKLEELIEREESGDHYPVPR